MSTVRANLQQRGLSVRSIDAEEIVPEQPAQSSARREWTGNWTVFDAATGETLYTFGGVGNNQGDANRVARNWLVSQGTPVREIEVYPEMAEVVSDSNFR